MDAKVFKVGSQTCAVDGFEFSSFSLSTATCTCERFLSFRHFREVGELVGSEKELFALGSIAMTLGIGGVDVILNASCLDSCEESTLVFHLEEYLPGFNCQTVSEVFNII